MVIYRVNTSSGLISVKAPVSWEETSTLLFEELYRNEVTVEDPLRTFSVITGLEIEEIATSNDRDLEAGLYQVNAFVFNQPEAFRQLPVPNRIRIRGEWITIPRNKIDKHTIAQGLAIRKELRTAVNLESVISMAIAVYLQPIIDREPFDLSKARELRREIQALPIFETFPLGFFLAKKHAKRGPSGTGFWRQLLLRLKSFVKRSPSSPTLKSSSRSGRSPSSRPTRGPLASCRAWLNASRWTRSWLTLFCGCIAMSTTSATMRLAKN